MIFLNDKLQKNGTNWTNLSSSGQDRLSFFELSFFRDPIDFRSRPLRNEEVESRKTESSKERKRDPQRSTDKAKLYVCNRSIG